MRCSVHGGCTFMSTKDRVVMLGDFRIRAIGIIAHAIDIRRCMDSGRSMLGSLIFGSVNMVAFHSFDDDGSTDCYLIGNTVYIELPERGSDIRIICPSLEAELAMKDAVISFIENR